MCTCRTSLIRPCALVAKCGHPRQHSTEENYHSGSVVSESGFHGRDEFDDWVRFDGEVEGAKASCGDGRRLRRKNLCQDGLPRSCLTELFSKLGNSVVGLICSRSSWISSSLRVRSQFRHIRSRISSSGAVGVPHTAFPVKAPCSCSSSTIAVWFPSMARSRGVSDVSERTFTSTRRLSDLSHSRSSLVAS